MATNTSIRLKDFETMQCRCEPGEQEQPLCYCGDKPREGSVSPSHRTTPSETRIDKQPPEVLHQVAERLEAERKAWLTAPGAAAREAKRAALSGSQAAAAMYRGGKRKSRRKTKRKTKRKTRRKTRRKLKARRKRKTRRHRRRR